MTEHVISAQDLTKIYGDLTAVNHINLTVQKGALFGLLGPNGSGKSTMIKMLTGQIRPNTGRATVLGIDVQQNPIGVRERVGIIPEQETPPSFLTATEYLQFVGAIRKIPDISERATWWFDFLDFKDKKDVLCKDLPGGPGKNLCLPRRSSMHRRSLLLMNRLSISIPSCSMWSKTISRTM